MILREFPMPWAEKMAQALFEEWCDVLLTEEEKLGERVN